MYSKENHAFGLTLLKWRKLRRLNQEQLAKLLGVNRPSIGNWERGTSAPTYAQAVKISSVLGFTMTDVDATLKELNHV